MIIFAYWQPLKEALARDWPIDAKRHLELLLDFLKLEHPLTTAKLAEIEQGRCKKIAFEKLWLLYPPNTPVYHFKGADQRQVVTYSIQNPEMTSKGPSGTHRDLVVRCWEVVWYSKNMAFQREFRDWVLSPYLGEKAIQNLELVPFQFVDQEEQLSQKLIDRGRHYFALNQAPVLQDYFGDRFPRVFKDVSS